MSTTRALSLSEVAACVVGAKITAVLEVEPDVLLFVLDGENRMLIGVSDGSLAIAVVAEREVSPNEPS